MDSRQKNILEHMLGEIRFIENETADVSFKQFQENELLKRGIIMALLNIGELANALDFDFYTEHSQIPWRDIIGLRNAAAHGYFVLRLETVWATLVQDLPHLKAFLVNTIPK